MGVSKNRGTPKSSILIGFSIVNHPFLGTFVFGNTYIWDVCRQIFVPPHLHRDYLLQSQVMIAGKGFSTTAKRHFVRVFGSKDGNTNDPLSEAEAIT